jgi:hypothetical protein
MLAKDHRLAFESRFHDGAVNYWRFSYWHILAIRWYVVAIRISQTACRLPLIAYC